MALNDLAKPSVDNSSRFTTRGARSDASGRVRRDAPRPSELERLAKPSRAADFYLNEDASEAPRAQALHGGLSAPKAQGGRAVGKQTPPRMQPVTTLPGVAHKMAAPRALQAGDVADSGALARLQGRFNLVEVQGDGFTSFVTALLHHGAQHPEQAQALADGLRSLEEPTGEISTEVHAGYAMIKRWAQALVDGRAGEVRNQAAAHPGAVKAIVLAMRGVVRHMQVFGALKRPAKDKVGHAADMDAIFALAKVCGVHVVTHGAETDATAEADANPAALHLLARSAPGHLDVLVGKQA